MATEAEIDEVRARFELELSIVADELRVAEAAEQAGPPAADGEE